VDVRKPEAPIVILRRRGEATWIEVLMWLQTRARIAGDKRDGDLIRSAGNSFVAKVEAVIAVNADDLVAAVFIVQVSSLGYVRKGSSRAVLLDAGDLQPSSTPLSSAWLPMYFWLTLGRMM
jgi:hypothetical protein